VIVVALGGSGGGDAAPAEAPSECLRAWNADPASTSFGTHNYSFGHDYRQARVSYRSAPELSESDDGECTVVFARLSLDQEPFAAGQILEGNKWESLSEIEGVDLNRVSELQGEALASPNASLLPDGRLAP
jgi:hypothetical protein